MDFSPVTILTSTPRELASLIVSAESGRGGSSREISPTSSQLAPPSVLCATPRERRPLLARSAMYLPPHERHSRQTLVRRA